MDIYMASTILIVFVVFGCIPLVVSMLTGIGPYLECLLAGVLFMACVAGIIAAIGAVLWSAFYVLSYSVT